jgi:TolA-binding protein
MTFGSITRNLSFLGAGFALLATSAPALPQDGNEEARLRRLEAEVRALQRRVFPGGDGRFFEPEISAPPSVDSTVTNPSTSAVTDILARLDALEAQLQRQTAQNEESANAIRLLTERVATLESSESSASAVAATAPASETAAQPAGGAARSVAAAEPSGPSDERLAAVQSIAKPQTEDPADDEYSYGYRLWNAGFYPEAQQQLTLFVEQNPSHWRTTYGRNLLGRAYLDDGNAKEAAPWFLKNYQEDKTGARAGDSLLYLAEAMIALDDTRRACIALAEFSETYPALAAGRLQSQYEANRGKVNCN